MTDPLFNLMAVAARLQQRAFIRKLHQATTIQSNFLHSLIEFHRETKLGQDLKLQNISTVEQFRQQIPRSSFADYEPYFDRVAAGESNVISPEPTLYMNLSSGTTSKQKLIPITRRAHQKRVYANRLALGFATTMAQRQHVTLGKMVLTTSALPIGKTEGNIPYGHVSANQLRSSNRWLTQAIYDQPFEALQIKNTLARYYTCLVFALQNPEIRIVSGIFPIILLQLCAYLEEYAEALINSIECGELPPWLSMETGQRNKLQHQLRPAPKRSKILRQIWKSEGRLLPKQVWPNLSLIITARGGPSDFYFKQFPEYFGNLPIFGATYAATEAVIGIHHDFDTDGTIPAIESNFFEFVPYGQWDRENPQTLLPHEVEKGEYYRILLTNYSGFYRYDIGDVVEVVGFWNQLPLITFRHRQGGTLSALSEKTTEYHVMEVMTKLQDITGLKVEDFCVTLSQELLPPFYILNLELSADQNMTQPELILEQFDQLLQSINTSYALKRNNNDIAPPQLNLLKSGSFDYLRQNKLRQDLPEACQAKIPHISNTYNLL